jgi:hypothetical protein
MGCARNAQRILRFPGPAYQNEEKTEKEFLSPSYCTDPLLEKDSIFVSSGSRFFGEGINHFDSVKMMPFVQSAGRAQNQSAGLPQQGNGF